ncbi:hypothetical protein DC3_14520 [Deinococcus cellulosilyticus NBRC 106333 = KACC 11606]|uniref:Uncharacterized protein n=2 Tax=Deinococcus cellulosilyticus TaxID=401558 RepID=A0A511N053_DEIC1|nr:hypothetical protein DC3_14520 [Deinococcus cellulosilyticus NBRC 106333 = KACC 11606]
MAPAEDCVLTVLVQQVPRDHDRFIVYNIFFGGILMVVLLIFFLPGMDPRSMGIGLLLSLLGMVTLAGLRGIWFRIRKMPLFSGVTRVILSPAGLQIEGLGTTHWSAIESFHETGDHNGLVVIQVKKQHDLFLSVPDRDQVDRLLASLAFHGKAQSIQTQHDP